MDCDVYFVVCASINRLLVVCVCVQRLGTVDRLIVMLQLFISLHLLDGVFIDVISFVNPS